jgi:hypothetical protein
LAVAAVIGFALVPDCDPTEAPAPSVKASLTSPGNPPKPSREVGKRKRLVSSRTRRVLSTVEDTVVVPVDDNGDIPMDFSAMKAVQQCVENDLALRCFEDLEGDLACFREDGTPPMIRVVHEFPPEIEGVVYRMDYSKSRSGGDTFVDFEVEMDDPVIAGQDLSALCRGIRNRIYGGRDGEAEVADMEEIEDLNHQLDSGDDVLGDLNGLALNSTNIGGGFTKVDLASLGIPGFTGGIITIDEESSSVVFYTVSTLMNPVSIVVSGTDVETVLEKAEAHYLELITVPE